MAKLSAKKRSKAEAAMAEEESSEAESSEQVRVARIQLPGLPVRHYQVGEDEDADYASVRYKKEMGIISTSRNYDVTFLSMSNDAFSARYNEERGIAAAPGWPAAGNPDRAEQPFGLDRAGAPLAQGEPGVNSDDDETVPNHAAIAAVAEDEEEDEDDEDAVTEDDIKTMDKSDLVDVAKQLDVKGYKTMKVAKLRKEVLNAFRAQSESDEDEDEEDEE